VRGILLEAERAGFVQLFGRGGQLVQLTPAVMQVSTVSSPTACPGSI
jgi:hypothetical protein